MHEDDMQRAIAIISKGVDTMQFWSYNFKLVILEVIGEHFFFPKWAWLGMQVHAHTQVFNISLSFAIFRTVASLKGERKCLTLPAAPDFCRWLLFFLAEKVKDTLNETYMLKVTLALLSEKNTVP